MRKIRAIRPLLTAAAVCAATIAAPYAQQAADAITVPFTDPGRIGSVRISMLSGGMVVRGSNRRDVLVSSAGRGDEPLRRRTDVPAGLRQLTQAPGLTITEQNNEITIGSSVHNRGVDIEVQVPSRVNLKLLAHNNGDVVVDGAEGDIEVTNHNGDIRLTNVGGSVVANTHNGNVRVTLTRVTTDKAMAFTSFNGDVDVTLPATAKANLKLRSDRGEIFTDFDVQTLQATPPTPTRRPDGRIRMEVNQALYGAINGGGPEFELRTYNGDIFVRRGQ